MTTQKLRNLATTVRCDARDAAMALKLLEENDIKVFSMTDLFRESVSLIAELAIAKGVIQRIDSTDQAVQILKNEGLIDAVKASDIQKKSLAESLVGVKPERSEPDEFKSNYEQQWPSPSHSPPTSTPPPEMKDFAAELQRRMEEDKVLRANLQTTDHIDTAEEEDDEEK